MTYKVELAINHNGRFTGWQSFGPIPSKREAWEFIRSHGFTAADKGDKWMVSEGSEDEA